VSRGERQIGTDAAVFRIVHVALRWQAQPEAITFLSLMLNPLFSLAMGIPVLFSAVAAGEKNLRLRCVAVYTPTKTATAPCGACRQVIYEFGPDARVFSCCDSREFIDVSIDALLPGAFGPHDLT